MLLRLALEEFVIVPRAELEFSRGLNALTGETGAGKSILVDAVEFLTGGRASGDWLRHGAAKTIVEGEIDLERAEPARESAARLEIPLEEGRLLLRREMGADGRSRCFAGGRQVRVADLRALTEGAVWIVGQGDQRALTTPAEQELLLDRFGGALEARARYRAARERFLTARESLARLDAEREAFVREEAWLEFQAREIREAEIEPGERARLRALRERARTAREDAGLASEVEARLFRDEGSVLDHLETMVWRLERASGESWLPLLDAVRTLRDAAREARALVPDEAIEEDVDLDALEERVRLLDRLVRKHGGGTGAAAASADASAVASSEASTDAASEGSRGATSGGPPDPSHEVSGEEAVLERLADLEARLDDGRALERRIAAAAETVEIARRETASEGARLGRLRRDAAERFTVATAAELEPIGMRGASLAFRFESEPDPDGVAPESSVRVRPLEGGLERVHLLFRSHPSEPEGEIGRIASGGEISRVLLAIHAALGEAGPPGCWVLDEVDAGVGGETANRVAERLARMAAHAQVLLVTHLPAVAARAGRHLSVVKEEVGGRPAARVEALDEEARVAELARMLAGDPGSAIARRHARELLGRRT